MGYCLLQYTLIIYLKQLTTLKYNTDQNIKGMGQDYIPLEGGTKKQKYAYLIQQLKQRVDSNFHPQSNRSNALALLKVQFGWWWIGYYFVYGGKPKGEKVEQRLVLGAFQGPPACTQIFKNNGVCGTCWEQDKPIVVKNVNQFPGHIACSSKSLSQIVIPIRRGNRFIGLLDVDSQKEADFDDIDLEYLGIVMGVLEGVDGFWDWDLGRE